MSRGSVREPTLHVVAWSDPTSPPVLARPSSPASDSWPPPPAPSSSPSTKTIVAGHGPTGRRSRIWPSPLPTPPFGSRHETLTCWPGLALSDHTQLLIVNSSAASQVWTSAHHTELNLSASDSGWSFEDCQTHFTYSVPLSTIDVKNVFYVFYFGHVCTF